MTSEARLKLEKAARLYIEMRRFKLIEQNWAQGKTKIDIIVPITESDLKLRQQAAEAWIAETKYEGKYIFSSIDLSEPNLAILGFSEDLI